MTLERSEKNFLRRLFRSRDVFIRHQDGVSCCVLSTARQCVLFLILCATVGWSVFTSNYFFRYEAEISEKKQELAKLKADYADLQGEILAFAEHVGRVAEAIEDNRQAIRLLRQERDGLDNDENKVLKANEYPLREKTAADDPVAQINKKTESLKAETDLVRERLAGLTENGKNAKNEFSFHQVVLQRDIAETEARALHEKVKNLERQISGMQETQLLVFRKMASLAGGNIDLIENDLSGIKQSLTKTGLGMESLLSRIRRDKENVGIGGPFIPAPVSQPQHRLNISLVSLNQRLDRWYDLTTLLNALPIGKPIEQIRVTSPFGSRGDPFQGAPAHHEAVDLGGMMGEPVYTKAPGKVVRAGRWGWYGNMVEIDHGLGFRTRYAHLDKIFVSKGDTVRSGDRIGTVGNSGRSTGPHLHYEIRVRGHAVDPMNFIKAKKNVFKG